MEVNIKNKKYNYVEKSVVKLNDISASLINIIRKEYIGINTYHIDYYYLEDDIEIKPFYFATIMIFCIKFVQTGYIWLKTEKVKSTIVFCIFELV